MIEGSNSYIEPPNELAALGSTNLDPENATEVDFVKRGSTAIFVEKLAPRDSVAHGPGSRGVSPNAAAG